MKKARVLSILSGLFLSTLISCSKKPDATCPGYAIYIPNSFSPNGDEINDVFKAKGKGMYDYEMLIFNNSGNQIYKTTDFNVGWNGAVQGDTAICPQGAYIYQIKAMDECGNQHSYAGNLSLLK
ncbi:MAG TPA: gliding motility-associated C-terminal domain-containing protein [Bacteroidia bacterium]|jgi:gliding motility-associated-like protein|nr:gliding motility-associated C-terminal domain-containing protein [Bacteroidia bacterium]